MIDFTASPYRTPNYKNDCNISKINSSLLTRDILIDPFHFPECSFPFDRPALLPLTFYPRILSALILHPSRLSFLLHTFCFMSPSIYSISSVPSYFIPHPVCHLGTAHNNVGRDDGDER